MSVIFASFMFCQSPQKAFRCNNNNVIAIYQPFSPNLAEIILMHNVRYSTYTEEMGVKYDESFSGSL